MRVDLYKTGYNSGTPYRSIDLTLPGKIEDWVKVLTLKGCRYTSEYLPTGLHCLCVEGPDESGESIDLATRLITPEGATDLGKLVTDTWTDLIREAVRTLSKYA